MAQGDDASILATWARELPTVSPLFPLTSRAVRRCVLAAERLGLMCVPFIVNMAIDEEYFETDSATLGWTAAKSMGPVCIVHMDLPEDHQFARIVPKVAGTAFTDGSVIQGDAFDFPRRYNGTTMESPIPVPATYQVAVEMTDVGNDYDDGDGGTFYTLGVLARVRATRSTCLAPDDVAAQWLKDVAKDGVWWGTTLEGNKRGGTEKGPITAPTVVETLVLAETRAIVEGTGNSISTQLRLAQQQTNIVTPFAGRLFGRRTDVSQRMLVQSGLRWAVAGATDIELETNYAAATATPLAVRATFLGRRGGAAESCMDVGLLL